MRWRHRLISYRSDPGQTQADSISPFFKLYFLILMDVENILCFHGMARTRSQGWILFPVIICNTYWSEDQLPIIFNALPATYNTTTKKCGLLMMNSQRKEWHSHQKLLPTSFSSKNIGYPIPDWYAWYIQTLMYLSQTGFFNLYWYVVFQIFSPAMEATDFPFFVMFPHAWVNIANASFSICRLSWSSMPLGGIFTIYLLYHVDK